MNCPRCGNDAKLDHPLVGKKFNIEITVCHAYDDFPEYVWVTSPLFVGEMILIKYIERCIEESRQQNLFDKGSSNGKK